MYFLFRRCPDVAFDGCCEKCWNRSAARCRSIPSFYIVRPTDENSRQAIARQDSIVLVKGARQVGKTSLLARGLQQARERARRSCSRTFRP